MTQQAAGPPLSPDGAWIWAGNGWVPNPAGAVRAPFRVPRVSSALATALLFLAGAAGIFLAMAAFHRASFAAALLNGSATGDVVGQAQSADDLLRGSLVGLLAVTVVTGAPFLAWMYLVVRNNAALGGRTLDFGPGAAVAWWFCPGASYVQPYRALSETWKVSEPVGGPLTRDRRRMIRAGALLPAWWLAFAGGNLLFVAGRLGPGTGTLEDVRAHDLLLAAAGTVSALAAFLGAAVVRSVTARQEHKAALLAAGALSPVEQPAG